MSSRARIFAAVTLLFSCLAGSPAWAQAQNLEAGKTPSQLFAGTCNACHKSPRGLLRTVSPSSLPGFLREHYTTSSDMASQLASFLISNGAGDNRQARQGGDPKQGGAGDQNDRQGRKQRPTQEAGRPAVEIPLPGESARPPRKRFGTDETRPGPNAPAEAALEGGPDGHKSGKQRLGKRGRPGEDVTETPKVEPGTSDQAKGDTAKEEGGASERTAPSSEAKAGEAKPSEPRSNEARDEKAVMRRDPVPPVTPAPAAMSPPVAAVPSEPAAPAPKAPATAAEPPAMTASAPPPRPAGPPSPPISQ